MSAFLLEQGTTALLMVPTPTVDPDQVSPQCQTASLVEALAAYKKPLP